MYGLTKDRFLGRKFNYSTTFYKYGIPDWLYLAMDRDNLYNIGASAGLKNASWLGGAVNFTNGYSKFGKHRRLANVASQGWSIPDTYNGSLTVFCWAYTAVTGSQLLVGRRNAATDIANFYALEFNNTTGVRCAISNNVAADTLVTSGVALTLSSWNFAAFTYNTSTKAIRVFHNLNTVATGTATNDTLVAQNLFFANKSVSGAQINGYMGMAGMWPKVLTDAQVQKIYSDTKYWFYK